MKSKDKPLKIFICPNCKSTDVYHPLEFSTLFGLMPKWRCRKCKFESVGFPQVIIPKNKLNKINEDYKNKAKKTKKTKSTGRKKK